MIENQKLLNWSKHVNQSNSRLKTVKRKAKVLTVSFKRRKLQEVGSRSRFDVDRSFGVDNLSSAGPTGGFTDIINGQKNYEATLIVEKSSNYQNHSNTPGWLGPGTTSTTVQIERSSIPSSRRITSPSCCWIST